MNLRSNIYHNLVDGATSYSILEEGTYNTHNISVNYSARQGNNSFNSGISARATNDEAAYRDDFKVHRWFAGFDSHTNDLEYGLTVGYVYGSFSDLVFSRAVTGGMGHFNVGGFSFQPVYGMQYGAVKDSMYRRNSMGFRAAQELGEGWNAGFSYALTSDDEDSMDDDNEIVPVEKNTVYGFDITGMLYENLTMRLDTAWSGREEEISDIEEEGRAYKLRADYRTRTFSLGGEYSVAGSSFSSLSGYADRDRRVRAFSAGYRFADFANARFSYETYNNNIDDNLEYTTAVSAPRLRTDFRLTGNIMLNLDLRSRKIESDDRDTTVNRRFKARGGGIRYAIGTSNMGFNYTLSENEDKNDSGNDYEEDALSLTAGGSYRIKEGAVRLSPSASYRQSIRERSAGDRDRSSGYTLALNGRFSDIAAAGISHSCSRRSGGSTSSRVAMSFSYFIAGNTGRALELEYSVRDNDSGEKDTSYTDSVLRAGTSLRF